VAKLSTDARSKLPKSAFAYIDSRGKRRLPIHDEAHVRNALARFERVAFESATARERARRRLLNAAKKHGIVPVGFITGQFQSERAAQRSELAHLPAGVVTFLMSDIEGSTQLLRRIEPEYPALLAEVRRIHRRIVRGAGGHEIDARADEYFACFEDAGAALSAAIAIQRRLAQRSWSSERVRVRIGLHCGRPTLTDEGYVGVAVHVAARVCGASSGGQILVSQRVKESLATPLPDGASFRGKGLHRLRGLSGEHRLFEVRAKGVLSGAAPRS
jgi:class 3 adenylate cyclase